MSAKYGVPLCALSFHFLGFFGEKRHFILMSLTLLLSPFMVGAFCISVKKFSLIPISQRNSPIIMFLCDQEFTGIWGRALILYVGLALIVQDTLASLDPGYQMPLALFLSLKQSQTLPYIFKCSLGGGTTS